MQFLFMTLFALAIALADQATKLLVVQNIPLHTQVPVMDGLVHLTYVQNFGAAFSALQGMRWLFVVIFLALTAAILWEYFKSPMPFTKLDRWLIAAVYGGGLGNMIDRVRLGFVVDMIEVEFIDFPVFNLADCFITCGCILLIIRLVFFNKAFWKDEKK